MIRESVPALPAGESPAVVDFSSTSAMLRFAGPEVVDGGVAMLAFEGGRIITGTEVRIDGGTHF